MDYILEVENLSKSYEDFDLDNISFKIPSGSIMGLVGENGSGKTTSIKSILKIVNKDSGRVRVFNKDMDEFDREIKEDIGVVLDDAFFHESFTAINIDRVLKDVYREWDSKVFFSYLERFKLPKKKIIKEYSKGMLMKLKISAALSHKAKLLILDEPTAGLDPMVRTDILDELLDFIQDEDRAILFSTHITSDLDKIADYITFIHKGQLMLSMDREELLGNFGIIKFGLDDQFVDMEDLVNYKSNKFGREGLLKDLEKNREKYSGYPIDQVNIEDIMLFYTRGEK